MKYLQLSPKFCVDMYEWEYHPDQNILEGPAQSIIPQAINSSLNYAKVNTSYIGTFGKLLSLGWGNIAHSPQKVTECCNRKKLEQIFISGNPSKISQVPLKSCPFYQNSNFIQLAVFQNLRFWCKNWSSQKTKVTFLFNFLI